MKNKRPSFRQVAFWFHRGPIRLRIRKIELISLQEDGKIIVSKYLRLFGNLWILKKGEFKDEKK